MNNEKLEAGVASDFNRELDINNQNIKVKESNVACIYLIKVLQ